VAIARILVDGYSLLNSWPDLAAGHSPFSATARSALIHRMGQYRDAVNIPIVIVFDGGAAPVGTPSDPAPIGLEIIYSKAGQTADQIIERLVELMRPHGEALVVTDDFAERDTVMSLGGSSSNCMTFIGSVEAAVNDMSRNIKRRNEKEVSHFKRPNHKNNKGI
jgi:predicted RNA-binding protein with PIN domain